MDDRVQQRKIKHRLAVLRHASRATSPRRAGTTGSAARRSTSGCIASRSSATKGLRDGSARPKHSPNATKGEVVGKIIYLRQNYHFEPLKISMYLKRYHDIDIGKSAVWRILNRLDLNRLPASQRYKRHDRRWKRYEKQLPGHRVQVDVKFIEPLPGSAGALAATAAFGADEAHAAKATITNVAARIAT